MNSAKERIMERFVEEEHLEEMATLRKQRSKLPVNLYLDDSGSWKNTGHGKRIKFQADKADRPMTRDMIPMSIEDEPKILIKNPKISLSASDLDKIKNFVRANKVLLLQLSDTKIDIGEFLSKMKTE